MVKNEQCLDCKNYNNGWCKVRKTNKGLSELIFCEFKQTEKLDKLKEYLEQKKFELNIENNSYNRGVVKGIEVALLIMCSPD